MRIAQPSSAASSRGTSSGSGTTAVAGQTTSSAIAPRPRHASNGVPSASDPPGVPVSPSIAEHSHGSPWLQNQHVRHGTAQLRTTWSPTATPVTASPTSVTTPAASWPSTCGYDGDSVPLTIDRSEWQTPTPATRTRTSAGVSGRSSTSITCRVSVPVATSARVIVLLRSTAVSARS